MATDSSILSTYSRNNKNGRILSILILFLCIGLSIFGQYIGSICLLPALLADIICSPCLSRKERMMSSSLVKAMLFCQGLGVWWLWSTFYSSDLLFHKFEENRLDPRIVHMVYTNKMHDSKDNNHGKNRKLRKNPSMDTINSDSSYNSLYFSQEDILLTPKYASEELIENSIGHLPPVRYPDLKYRPSSEIRIKYKRIFEELPKNGFLTEYKNPCWIKTGDVISDISIGRLPSLLACLPYAYILGMPKCGTSDLFERLSEHPRVKPPKRKEVRWFTRGEFSTAALPRDGHFPLPYHDTLQNIDNMPTETPYHHEKLLGPSSSIYAFTASFVDAARSIALKPSDSEIITIDGGPHTLWWPTQGPDGELLSEDVPPSQLIREIQPNAKFIITLADPVRRMYSDYYFLNDDLRPVNMRSSQPSSKSAIEFHERVKSQIDKFNECVEQIKAVLEHEISIVGEDGEEYLEDNNRSYGPLWFRASQMCAHDRHKFAVGGWGRLSIGLYSLFLEKWLEHFSMNQFLVVRLEDFQLNPSAYIQKVFDFLELKEVPDMSWAKILVDLKFNENTNQKKEPILEETEIMLREFYTPYNNMLVSLLNDTRFSWKSAVSLRQHQLDEIERKQNSNVGDNKEEYDIPRSHKRHRPRDGEQDLNHRHRTHPNDDNTQNNNLPWKHKSEIIDFNKDKDIDINTMIYHPKNFSMEGLPIPPLEFGVLTKDLNLIDLTGQKESGRYKDAEDNAATQLCFSAFGLDLAALKYLLYDTGLSPNTIYKEDSNRTPLLCLSLLSTMADPHPRSQIFASLRGVDTFLTARMKPTLPLQMRSVHTKQILDGISDAIRDTAQWLLRAGADVMAMDKGGNTFLHHAAKAGFYSLVDIVLNKQEIQLSSMEEYKLVNHANHDGRTALHYAAANGNIEVLKLLVDHQGDMTIKDPHGVSTKDIVETHGPISTEDALKYLNIQQKPVKHIPNRKELHSKVPKGGWSPERLEGFEEDYYCAIDQYWADEITGDEIFERYIARNSPVLIRGLLDPSTFLAYDFYIKENITEIFGHLNVEVSDIPYASKFGGDGKIHMTLKEYIEEMSSHKIVGGSYPWYVFRGHPIPSGTEGTKSTVPYHICPTPQKIYEAVKRFYPGKMDVEVTDVKSREVFVNAQWALGGEGTGAPVHYHNSAVNMLVYGAKKWIIYPPRDNIMSNMQIKHYFETDLKDFESRGITSKSCVQLAGDVMIIPENWGHGVLNLEESVAIASEIKNSLWRIKPGSSIPNSLPFDNMDIAAKSFGKDHVEGKQGTD